MNTTLHKYNFFGQIRIYRNQLQLIDSSVIYLGITDEKINHWQQSVPFIATEKTIQKVIPNNILIPDNFKPSEEIEQFLKDTVAYDSAKFPERLLIKKKSNQKIGRIPPNEHRVKCEDVESFVYLINGVKHYWKKFTEFQNEIAEKNDIKYLGIEKHQPFFEPKWSRTPSRNRIIDWSSYFCCYCETPLFYNNYTREHLIPSSRGGKNKQSNLRPCCKDCNTEKGDLMLHTYIQILNYQLFGKTGFTLIRLNTKIKNANMLAMEINPK